MARRGQAFGEYIGCVVGGVNVVEPNASLTFLVMGVMVLDGNMLRLLSYDSSVNELQGSLIV